MQCERHHNRAGPDLLTFSFSDTNPLITLPRRVLYSAFAHNMYTDADQSGPTHHMRTAEEAAVTRTPSAVTPDAVKLQEW